SSDALTPSQDRCGSIVPRASTAVHTFSGSAPPKSTARLAALLLSGVQGETHALFFCVAAGGAGRNRASLGVLERELRPGRAFDHASRPRSTAVQRSAAGDQSAAGAQPAPGDHPTAA